jgi:hypothetical protein
MVISATSTDRNIQTLIQTKDGIGQLYRLRLIREWRFPPQIERSAMPQKAKKDVT